jgi:hypothetical protein
MDLLSKAIIAAVIIVIIIFAGYFAISHVSFGQQVTEAQATSLVLHDLQNSNPSAVINITNVTPSQFPGSWHILASIVTNATSPCPTYLIYSFDYPKYGFVSTVDNIYTSNCTVHGITPGKGYIIGAYPMAITESYLKNVSVVNNFISRYGFNNVVVTATYYNSTTFSGESYHGVWLVDYTAPNSNQTVEVLLSQVNGTVLSTRGAV